MVKWQPIARAIQSLQMCRLSAHTCRNIARLNKLRTAYQNSRTINVAGTQARKTHQKQHILFLFLFCERETTFYGVVYNPRNTPIVAHVAGDEEAVLPAGAGSRRATLALPRNRLLVPRVMQRHPEAAAEHAVLHLLLLLAADGRRAAVGIGHAYAHARAAQGSHMCVNVFRLLALNALEISW
jgi:hypothetical protein